MKDQARANVKPAKIKPPVTPARARLHAATSQDVANDETLDGVHLDDLALDDRTVAHLQLSGAEVSLGSAVGAELDHLRLTDVRITAADWSNAVMYRTAWTRVAATGAKLVGTRLNEGSFRDVLFEECIGDLLQAQMGSFERVRFATCRLRGAMFNESDLSGCVFDGCDLREADFTRANLSGADIRRSEIEGIHLGADQLRGLIVTPDQALYLAGAIGLVIEG